MGMAKAGKSYFISKLLKEMGSEEKVEIDDSLSPCTRDLQSVAIDGLSSDNPTLKGRRLLIVDTPGFCDESSTDYNILTGIVDWLDHSREKGDALGGVIYVHDISLDDFSRPVRENLEIFERMCGEAFLKKVVLMTTKWGRAQDDRDFEAMENQLRIGFWKGMIERGARTMRLDSDDENKGGSALHIVANLLERVASPDSEASLEELMQVQREVIGHRPINLAETDAGKAMQDQLAVRRKALQGEPRNLARETNSKRGKPQSKSFTGRFFPRGRRFTGA
ncbi:hypothetical protein DFP72DRAFT_912751 [Ephemerocybe angulata]|uniref:G domain-containing protein n=1 Tax=Ephemerocybe angulata TaxID=980116 RepID=A0A8H6HM00_9AGAR|nr:hypothetical protein DFP72DRAFT_912751 [Tulosesus angulatus]